MAVMANGDEYRNTDNDDNNNYNSDYNGNNNSGNDNSCCGALSLS